MNPGICYLYEYKNNQKLRNVGFMKITSHFRSCILQINARGIPVQTGEPVKIHAFYEKASDYIVKPIEDIACGDKSIYAKLTANETSLPDGKGLENIGGFLLMVNGHYYAALSDNASFDTSRIKMWEEQVSAAEAVTVNISNDIPGLDNESLDSGSYAAEEESVDTNPYVEEKGSADNDIYMPQAVPEEANEYLTGMEAIGSEIVETNISPAETKPSDDDFYVTETGFFQDVNPDYETQLDSTAAPSDIDAENLEEQEPRENVKKIHHCDLTILPRKCWNLANNSFLMHGYHNYNHLLLVEEDGHFWLGVPGIYTSREAKAAELFGFPQFTQTYINQLDLTEGERNTSERFGHWCRYIK